MPHHTCAYRKLNGSRHPANRLIVGPMGELFGFIWCAIAALFRSRAVLQAEILVLRHQLNILRRRSPKRVILGKVDRLVFCGLYRVSPTALNAPKILQPESVIRWLRAGFRAYRRWRSRRPGGRPRIPADIRHLICEMSVASPLWGAPRVHGDMLKLGIAVGQITVAKYMARRRRPPSQGGNTFLRNHAEGIASIDLSVVPTISFRPIWTSGPAAFAAGAYMSSTKSSAFFEPRAQNHQRREKSTSHVGNPAEGALLRILWRDSLPCSAALSGQPPKPGGAPLRARG
jgi:hypothetical protein